MLTPDDAMQKCLSDLYFVSEVRSQSGKFSLGILRHLNTEGLQDASRNEIIVEKEGQTSIIGKRTFRVRGINVILYPLTHCYMVGITLIRKKLRNLGRHRLPQHRGPTTP